MQAFDFTFMRKLAKLVDFLYGPFAHNKRGTAAPKSRDKAHPKQKAKAVLRRRAANRVARRSRRINRVIAANA